MMTVRCEVSLTPAFPLEFVLRFHGVLRFHSVKNSLSVTSTIINITFLILKLSLIYTGIFSQPYTPSL